jgi:nucleotide-binding universal stress UspA family protein
MGTRASRSSGRAAAVFEHVLVLLDDTPESLLAAAQAGVVRAPGGELELLAVAERHLAMHAGQAAAEAEEQLISDASLNLARAAELVDADEATLVTGRFTDVLGECARHDATLVAVGTRPHRRLAALTFGGRELDALHDASCSVLVARPGWGPHRPERIVVGIDGTPESQAAEATARALADRIGCELLPVVALAETVALEVLRAEREDAIVDPGPLVEAVPEAATRDSLVVVGRAAGTSRHPGGDLAERIVHRARCSVLIVRHEGRR